MQAAETARSAGRPTADLTAYDLYLRAYAMYLSSTRQIPEAFRLMEQAIARDPCYGPALAWGAFLCHRLLLDGRSENREADRLKCADFARRALEVARDDPVILANAANALGYLGEDIGAMLALVDRALALNPNFARGWHISGILRIEAGQPDIALEHLETALRLSPRARIGNSHNLIGNAHFFARRFDEAVPKLLLAIQEDPSFTVPYRHLAASYAHMAARRGARYRCAAARGHPCCDAGRLLLAERRAPRAVAIRLAPGDGRADMSQTRRLAAILAADVAGYSRLIGLDEGGTLQAFKAIRAELFDPTIAEHNGRLVKTTGDGFLVEFSSVVDALRCATEVQAHMAERYAPIPTDQRIEFRIGINVGDVVVEDSDIFGDGANIAARLEGLAEPGGICVSALVQRDAAGKLDLAFEDLGEQTLKNIARPLGVSGGDGARHRGCNRTPAAAPAR